MSNNIDTVRDHLLQTLAGLRDRNNPMDVDRARAIAQVAGVLVDTAKVEVDFLRATSRKDSTFFEASQVVSVIPAAPVIEAERVEPKPAETGFPRAPSSLLDMTRQLTGSSA